MQNNIFNNNNYKIKQRNKRENTSTQTDNTVIPCNGLFKKLNWFKFWCLLNHVQFCRETVKDLSQELSPIVAKKLLIKIKVTNYLLLPCDCGYMFLLILLDQWCSQVNM